uniref:Uncharacterized protein n=1 Tax=Arundo donax TaxID=35708 RepID=A0A0A9F1M7_ARUDO
MRWTGGTGGTASR